VSNFQLGLTWVLGEVMDRPIRMIQKDVRVYLSVA